jgi:hypothetical protein
MLRRIDARCAISDSLSRVNLPNMKKYSPVMALRFSTSAQSALSRWIRAANGLGASTTTTSPCTLSFFFTLRLLHHFGRHVENGIHHFSISAL